MVSIIINSHINLLILKSAEKLIKIDKFYKPYLQIKIVHWNLQSFKETDKNYKTYQFWYEGIIVIDMHKNW